MSEKMSHQEALERLEFRIRSTCTEACGGNIGDCYKCENYPCKDINAILVLCGTLKWIPVTERLPEDYSEVAIVIKKISSGAILTDIGYYLERRNKWRFVHSFGSYFDYEVIAWAPLPEPYEEGDT